MIISPIGNGQYAGIRVYTTVAGKRVHVGVYEAGSPAEVMRQAVLNAQVVQMRYGLAAKMRIA